MGAQGLGYYKDTPVVTPVVVRTLGRGRELGTGLAVIGDGAACRVVSGGDKTFAPSGQSMEELIIYGRRELTPVVMWNVESGETTIMKCDEPVEIIEVVGVATLAVGYKDGIFDLYDANDASLIKKVQVHGETKSRIRCIKALPDGSGFAVSSSGKGAGGIDLYDSSTGAHVKMLPLSNWTSIKNGKRQTGPPDVIAVAGNKLAGGGSGNITIWDWTTGCILQYMELGKIRIRKHPK